MVIFATIFGVGFLILLISLIFGHDADGDVSGADGDSHGPGILSIKMVSLLMVGFGAVGFGVRATTEWSMFRASMLGVAGAAAVGVVGYLILRMFYASQASSTISDNDIIGCQANLIDAIDGTEYGQAACILRGREITFLARSADGQSIARNTPVRVISKSGNVVTVKPIE